MSRRINSTADQLITAKCETILEGVSPPNRNVIHKVQECTIQFQNFVQQQPFIYAIIYTA